MYFLVDRISMEEGRKRGKERHVTSLTVAWKSGGKSSALSEVAKAGENQPRAESLFSGFAAMPFTVPLSLRPHFQLTYRREMIATTDGVCNVQFDGFCGT